MTALALTANSPPARRLTARRANIATATVTGDAALFAAYDEFSALHADLMTKRTDDADIATLSGATAGQKRALSAWEVALTATDGKAREILSMPAATVEGMLLKLHVVGFIAECSGRSFTTDLSKPWKVSNRWQRDEETDLLLSLRSDLQRMARGGSR